MHVRFGDFTLDTASRRLRHGDVERHLSPKAFDFLRLIIEHRPRVVSKAELHAWLWPSTSVAEATLNSLVAEVREALGEKSGAGHGFIRTVHRIGYAFDGAATDLQPPPATPAGHPPRCWIMWEAGEMALADGEYLIGRDGGAAVWLESTTVSRHHARIRVEGGAATIEDLGSRNGTILRGERITAPAPLAHGDEIRLGSVVMTFRSIGVADLAETQGL